MADEAFNSLKSRVFDILEGKLGKLHEPAEIYKYIESVVKAVDPAADKKIIDQIVSEAKTFQPIDKYLYSEDIEDIMVNNTDNIFAYSSSSGDVILPEKIRDDDELSLFVRKLRMYATSATANRHIYDVHLPNGSRCNIVDSPMGPAITIRNFKPKAYSIVDLVNAGELSYALAARFWLYADGLGIRPANMLIGGMPGSGKTTLLNSMFSFFRPEARIVVLEETYELNTKTQENCVNLETSPDVTIEDLLKNTLRMRPDLIIIGEVRGQEAKDMITAMTIGKICMSTVHASTARDIVTRLEHDPMRVSMDTIPLIDTLTVISQINAKGKRSRKVVQVAETSGIETQVLLSDLYTYDYKKQTGSDMLPSITYRDVLSKATGQSPSDIISEEKRRAKVLEKLNTMGVRDLKSINEFCREYYDNQGKAMAKLGLQALGTLE
ncbi:MAG: CpaF family protein [Candidatus Micrarchaeota archaeon]|nr:CpaF family protein [Candidatus Micrarchaeota archaeon]MDE1859894.1 CpaF family protein [Candidatus Micrarchaeota archaeon]